VNKEVLLQNLEDVKSSLLCIIDGLLVVRIFPNKRAEPATQGWEELRVGEGQPSDNGSVVLLCLAE
jgi:hypothetical protein